jgi:hypothetical protein
MTRPCPVKEAAMNDKNNNNNSRGLRRARALAVAAAVTVLVTACGDVHVHFGSASTGPQTYRDDVAFAQCMQTHGVPDFPEPTNPSESFSVSGHPNGNGNSPVARAYDACKQLLPPGSTNTGSDTVTQAQLELALKIAECLRAHGEPDFPDPTVVNGSLHFTVQLGAIQSAQFQAAVNACRPLIPKEVHLP